MGKAPGTPGPGIYSGTYSGIPVYEFQFGEDLKEHVMRRRRDDWINATHILKAAGFDKPARTRILERDVQKDVHEKIQGGYGKYQGTWIPLEAGEQLAQRHSIYDRLRPIFQYTPGNESPPPAPRHATKPKAFKTRPPSSGPKWAAPSKALPSTAVMQPAPPPLASSTSALVHDDFDNGSAVLGDEDTPDNLTVASASYMADDDRYDMSTMSRKRKREEHLQDLTEQQHAVYGDELLDYFLLSRNEQPAVKPEPPANFQPNWLIDAENHTALHWASAMGDVDVIKQLKRFNANVAVKNMRGETPLMRSVNFTNCYEKQSFPAVIKELFDTVDARDNSGCTVIHHAAVMKNGRVFSPSCSRYYLDNMLNRLQETLEPGAFQQLLDVQDKDGNTALHLAAQRNARKCIRALLGRNASTDLANNDGVRAEDLIMELNAAKKERGPQRSSSPFAPDSHRHASFRDALGDGNNNNKLSSSSASSRKALGVPGSALMATTATTTTAFQSAAARTVQTRITPLVVDKFHDLAKSYDGEWHEKHAAETEARRILANTQSELAAAHRQMAELESQLEPDEVAAKMNNEANVAKHQVLSLITHQNRLHIQQAVDGELNKAGPTQDEPYEERLALARQLSQMVADQRQAEMDYVDALSLVGTDDKIDKYRKLLMRCLDPKDGDCLDSNLDALIDMMEEERDPGEVSGGSGAPEPLDVAVGV
ncbi:hypothetical protein CDD80_4998 [Ophiocordyceps camponoti-rufipedis]|uniref:HTH APSES-type domain-containing protein n=1 Tax=Ophiocordyceps camponoti-rufipedis TaxID=2004952 RepID=A0A2C5YXX5_9HYPO|nr:hypothetical protein CDD80_4998 [Ophiocordyceps camponoti-rufipedis]